jgi:hypothetical protein
MCIPETGGELCWKRLCKAGGEPLTKAPSLFLRRGLGVVFARDQAVGNGVRDWYSVFSRITWMARLDLGAKRTGAARLRVIF